MVQCGAPGVSRFIEQDCDCHLLITKVEPKQNENGLSLKITFAVLASTVPDAVGKEIGEFFATDGGWVDRLYRLAIKGGVITQAAYDQAKAAKVGLSFDENLLVTRQICAGVQMQKKKKPNPNTGVYEVDPASKAFPHIDDRIYAITDPESASIPKNADFLRLLPSSQTGGTNGGDGGNGGQPPAGGLAGSAW